MTDLKKLVAQLVQFKMTPKRKLEIRDRSRNALKHASEILGNKSKLARAIGISPELMNTWISKSAYGCSPKYVLQIEELTKGEVKRYELRCDLYEK